MAGEWIKMRVGLTTNPHVLRIAEHLLTSGDYVEWAGLSWGMGGYPPMSREEADNERYVALRVTRYVTVTALLKFWGYANEHAKGDSIDGIRAQDVLEITGIPGFAAALESTGWVEFDPINGGVRMPNFEEHNTGHRERTNAGAERQKRYRERKKADVSGDVTRDVTVTEREEKRREEKKEHSSASLEGFESFWVAWPKSSRKEAKGKCQEAWVKAKAASVAEQVVAHVEAKKRTDWTKEDGRYVEAPLVYINQRRWEGAEEGSASSSKESFV